MKIEASSTFVRDFNLVMDDCVMNLPNHKNLGPCFSQDDFKPYDLAFHRVSSKFDLPGEYDKDLLHAKAVTDFHEFDAGLKGFRYSETTSDQRYVLYKARALLHDYLRDFKLLDSDLDFSPGETFISSRGKTSLYQKLSNIKNWTVTADAADEFIHICYKTRALKRVAMQHIYRRASRSELKHTWRAVVPDKRGIGYAVFAKLMNKHVLTIVLGSRMVTVYKNKKSRRLINIEPWGNVICQRRRGLALKRASLCASNDLSAGQDHHRVLISDLSKVTIDLRNASNSTATQSVLFMLPPRLFNSFNRVRSEFVYDGTNWCRPNLFSAMGNGFTFELMTMILLSVARVLDPNARVYGDDIIISSESADAFISAISALGYNINPEKTFLDGLFRESCGAFYHEKFGYLQSFDMKKPDDLIGCIIFTNKLFELKNVHPWFRDTYIKAQALFPAQHKGPPPSLSSDSRRSDLEAYWRKDFLAWYVWSDTKGRTKHPKVRGLFVSIEKGLENLNSMGIKSFEIIQGFKYTYDEASPFLDNLHLKNLSKMYYYIRAGRRTSDVIRNSNKVVSKLLIHYDGRAVEYKSLNRL